MKFRQRHLILPFSWFQMSLWSTAWAQTVSSATPSSYGSTPASSAWYGLVTLTLLVVLVAVVLRVYKRVGAAVCPMGASRCWRPNPWGPVNPWWWFKLRAAISCWAIRPRKFP